MNAWSGTPLGVETDHIRAANPATGLAIHEAASLSKSRPRRLSGGSKTRMSESKRVMAALLL
jgi:hypothetical protein